jgi:RNA polymerase subunit RPABC4/transcription elongation factor Spt4
MRRCKLCGRCMDSEDLYCLRCDQLVTEAWLDAARDPTA